MAMDTSVNQSSVAYADGPKEVNTKRGLHDGNKQFGKANKMAQDEKSPVKGYIKKVMAMHKGQSRHKEHR